MVSILNNAASLSALQALNMTQQSLSTVQNEVSTGLRVSTAADNSSYWSIAAQLNACRVARFLVSRSPGMSVP